MGADQSPVAAVPVIVASAMLQSAHQLVAVRDVDRIGGKDQVALAARVPLAEFLREDVVPGLPRLLLQQALVDLGLILLPPRVVPLDFVEHDDVRIHARRPRRDAVRAVNAIRTVAAVVGVPLKHAQVLARGPRCYRAGHRDGHDHRGVVLKCVGDRAVRRQHELIPAGREVRGRDPEARVAELRAKRRGHVRPRAARHLPEENGRSARSRIRPDVNLANPGILRGGQVESPSRDEERRRHRRIRDRRVDTRDRARVRSPGAHNQQGDHGRRANDRSVHFFPLRCRLSPAHALRRMKRSFERLSAGYVVG